MKWFKRIGIWWMLIIWWIFAMIYFIHALVRDAKNIWHLW